VHLAKRRALRAQVLERIRSAQRRGLLGGPRRPANTEPLGPPNPELIRAAITRALRPTIADVPGVEGRTAASRPAAPLPEDDNPPF